MNDVLSVSFRTLSSSLSQSKHSTLYVLCHFQRLYVNLQKRKYVFMKSAACTAGLIFGYMAWLFCCAKALLQLLLAPAELQRINIFTSRGTGCACISTGSVIAYVLFNDAACFWYYVTSEVSEKNTSVEYWWNDHGRVRPVPVSQCSPQIPHGDLL